MKKIFSITAAFLLCFALAACSTATLSGDLATYYNPDKSFSIDLPTSDEDAWAINEKAAGNVLDMKDKSDTVRIYVQCLSKLQAGAIASDLASYKDHAVMNTFSDVLTSAEMKETSIQVPDFIVESSADSFTYEGAKGIAVFMESEKCYYTYLVMAVEDAYDANEKVFGESIMSFKEITETP